MMDERQEENASLYVVGALDSEELIRFEAELKGNPELRRLVQQLQETAAELAWAPPLRRPSLGLKQRILREITMEKSSERKASVFPTVFIPWALAACLTVACVVLWKQRGDLRQEVARLESQDAVARMRIAQLSATLEDYKQVAAVVVWDPEKQKGVLRLARLPQVSSDKSYQLWAIDSRQPNPISAGTFAVNADGGGDVVVKTALPLGMETKFAISLEPRGGSASPQGPVVLIGP
jgi:anti-sigma-K factor RskA